jgi:phosphatidylglycerophosphatase A
MRSARLFVTFFYLGYSKIAPGSIASLVTTLIFYLFAKYLFFSLLIIIILVTTILSFIAVGVYTSGSSEKDKSEIVIDEVIGQSIALSPLLLFPEYNLPEFYMCLISLLFFRFFDIVKPFPINEVDKINSNFGVILDDILAGFFSAIFLTLILNL